MTIWLLIALIVGLTAAMAVYLGPLRLLRRREFWLSHLVMWLGLWLIWGFVVTLYPDRPLAELTMLMGGFWTLGGGICFAVLYVSRRLKRDGETPD
ncbi:hypothetical protein [Thalassovita taeanensis]|uniref:Uncharacterized protein n=1 Tax=Thalassovita taeanensis TaxID=657014 RepID=A0A1H9C6Z1_9RHOB|nr:hypothetical protein [Thalassovita taeanensis]SEP96751.1 hypothetical protein SAMN04488092_103140 [Thalassovita taeanensis]